MSNTGVRGWDVDVTVDGVEGAVTLVPSESDGTPSAWGQPDHWVSGGLLAVAHDREALDAIEAVAREAIEGSGVELPEAVRS